MGKKRYTIRFYRQHDLDLITFIMAYEFNAARAVYSVLSAFSKGEVFVIDIPPIRDIQMPQLKRVYTRALILDEEKDAEAIALLAKIKEGYRNNFMKNLLRQYLCYPVSIEFLVNKEDEAVFYDMSRIFRQGKKAVKAGKEKPARVKKISASNKQDEPEIKLAAPAEKSAYQPTNPIKAKNMKAENHVGAQEPGSDENGDDLLSMFQDMLG